MSTLTMFLEAAGIGTASGAVGYLVSHAGRTRIATTAARRELHATFDRHAPNWRTCTCDSCKQRREQAGVK